MKMFMENDKRYKNYDIGRFTYGGPEVLSWDSKIKLKMGAFCSVAEGVVILLGGEHNTQWITTYPFNKILKEFGHIKGHPRSKGDVIIGSDVWIGRKAVILSGLEIGDGCAVGANAVVTKSAPPYSILAGNPARVVKKRFDDETIKKLLRIKWWDWDIEKIKENIPLMLNDNIAEFVEKYIGDA